VITDERLKALPAIYAACLDSDDPLFAGHFNQVCAELLSLRAKHDKVMEALRESGPVLESAIKLMEVEVRAGSWPNVPAQVAKLRALAKLGEVTG
jgi:hypothetical protein